jgi:hypothetical protein
VREHRKSTITHLFIHSTDERGSRNFQEGLKSEDDLKEYLHRVSDAGYRSLGWELMGLTKSWVGIEVGMVERRWC